MRQWHDGVSEMTLAFSPGIEVEGEAVCRTFQPSFVVTGEGALLAFCQGRLRGGGDDDPKVILTSRSEDAGATWSPARAISGCMTHFAMSAYRSPRRHGERVSVLTMVDLRGTERIYGGDHGVMKRQTGIDISAVGCDTPMALCRFHSDDGGATWSMETLLGDRTPLNRRYADGTLVMFNPIGQVHVVPDGPWQGRYILGGPVTVVPADTAVSRYFRDHPQSGSGVIYSDDGGEVWQAGGFITDYLANEASAVSIRHGRELLLIRRVNAPAQIAAHPPLTEIRPGRQQRVAHLSSDGGHSWSSPFLVPISGVMCHGTLARAGRRLLFSIPLGDDALPGHGAERRNGAIHVSDDDGRSWRRKLIEPDTFSYSTVGTLDEELGIVLFARGSMGQDGVGCRVFSHDWLDTAR